MAFLRANRDRLTRRAQGPLRGQPAPRPGLQGRRMPSGRAGGAEDHRSPVRSVPRALRGRAGRAEGCRALVDDRADAGPRSRLLHADGVRVREPGSLAAAGHVVRRRSVRRSRRGAGRAARPRRRVRDGTGAGPAGARARGTRGARGAGARRVRGRGRRRRPRAGARPGAGAPRGRRRRGYVVRRPSVEGAAEDGRPRGRRLRRDRGGTRARGRDASRSGGCRTGPAGDVAAEALGRRSSPRRGAG